MNQDIFAGQWRQIRGELKSWWGKLVDSDFDRIGGQKDKLVGVVQEKYGYAREQAQQEVDRRLQEYSDSRSSPHSSGKRDAGAGSPAPAPNEGPIAAAITAVADGVESAQGAIATATTAVAGGVESASSYLQEKEFAVMAADLTALMRRYPVQSLLVGVGLGYILTRLMTK